MAKKGNTDEILIVLSMLDRIIMDDLLQESELEIFEEKKKWHDLWRRDIIETYGLEGAASLLGWDKLKDRVVEWLKGGRAPGDRQAILDRCLTFLPYGPLPYHRGKPPEQGRIQASPEARELSLEKICRLLGCEDKWQELFPTQLV